MIVVVAVVVVAVDKLAQFLHHTSAAEVIAVEVVAVVVAVEGELVAAAVPRPAAAVESTDTQNTAVEEKL